MWDQLRDRWRVRQTIAQTRPLCCSCDHFVRMLTISPPPVQEKFHNFWRSRANSIAFTFVTIQHGQIDSEKARA
ncbi:MAG: hypothetical protein EA377_02215, partial [Phycisphaerales bacterium]